ncbi:MAG: membrane dipeptidase [Woeseiaceae bacterium]|nr:membrane dipeptidase [Woeseiaceae bacterium]NIP19931.1 membrane dipeptidase [Woeseiaceae bacterium]NIS88732.1 membrane dipeptidase [Woeseiaceae bacterium]
MNYRILIVGALGLALAACEAPSPDPVEEVDDMAEARRIAKSSIIVDTHIDVPMRVHETGEDVTIATESGDFDHPRAVAGGLNAPFMSIYTGAHLEAAGRSREVAEELIDIVDNIVAKAPDKFAIARSPADVRRHFDEGIMSLALGMENGSPLEGDLAALKYFFDRGIRYITLAHSLSNHLSDSSYDANRQWGGLSDFGIEVVREMNRFGIMIDVSHLSDDAFWQVLKVSSAPVIASHSSARSFTPGWERNIDDEMIRALAENGGVVQVNFGSGFISPEAREYDNKRIPKAREYMARNPEVTMSEMLRDWNRAYIAENGPYPYATLDDVLDHFDHIVSLAGIDHVGIGSDYDGVGDTLPVGVKDVSSYPNLIAGLLRRGYSEADIKKILGENLLRVWEAVEARAVRKQETGPGA